VLVPASISASGSHMTTVLITFQSLYQGDVDLQYVSLKCLMTAWILLPPEIVDPAPTAQLYLLLYAVPWIFANLLVNTQSSVNIIYVIDNQ